MNRWFHNQNFLQTLNPRHIFIGSLVFYLTLNIFHLSDPPYWDAILGVYTQGVWLKNNGFDIIELSRMPGFIHGGPNLDPLLLVPVIFAFLSTQFSPPVVFCIFHVFNYLCAALAITLFYILIRKKTSPGTALLFCIVPAVNPSFSGQVAAIYIEIPALACISLSFYFLAQEKPVEASVLCVSVTFMKYIALLPAATLFTVAIVRLSRQFYLRKTIGRKEIRDMVILSLPFLIFLVLNRRIFFNEMPESDFLSKLNLFWVRLPYLYPYLAVQIATILALLCSHLLSRTHRTRLLQNEAEFTLFTVMTIFFLLFWWGFLTYYNSLIRYAVIVQLPMVFLLAFLLSGHKKMSVLVACVFIMISIFNQNGQLLRPLPSNKLRSGHLLERSREYLKDLNGNRRICRFLETHYFDYPIVTKYPFSQMLTVPEFGYVKKALPNIIEMGRTSTVTNVTGFDAYRQQKKDFETLCVYSPNVYERLWGRSLRPTENDRIVFQDHSLPGTVSIHMRTWRE